MLQYANYWFFISEQMPTTAFEINNSTISMATGNLKIDNIEIRNILNDNNNYIFTTEVPDNININFGRPNIEVKNIAIPYKISNDINIPVINDNSEYFKILPIQVASIPNPEDYVLVYNDNLIPYKDFSEYVLGYKTIYIKILLNSDLNTLSLRLRINNTYLEENIYQSIFTVDDIKNAIIDYCIKNNYYIEIEQSDQLSYETMSNYLKFDKEYEIQSSQLISFEPTSLDIAMYDNAKDYYSDLVYPLCTFQGIDIVNVNELGSDVVYGLMSNYNLIDMNEIFQLSIMKDKTIHVKSGEHKIVIQFFSEALKYGYHNVLLESAPTLEGLTFKQLPISNKWILDKGFSSTKSGLSRRVILNFIIKSLENTIGSRYDSQLVTKINNILQQVVSENLAEEAILLDGYPKITNKRTINIGIRLTISGEHFVEIIRFTNN